MRHKAEKGNSFPRVWRDSEGPLLGGHARDLVYLLIGALLNSSKPFTASKK